MSTLPVDLAEPHQTWGERTSFWAGVIVGGFLILIASGMLVYALTLG